MVVGDVAVREWLVGWQRQGEELAERWWAVVGDLQAAEARVGRLEAAKQAQAARLLGGMTPRQRARVQNRRIGVSARGNASLGTMRRRQLWAHRQAQLRRLDDAWASRLEAAGVEVGETRRVLAGVAREALGMWEVHPEVYVGRTRRQLQHLARYGS